VTDDKPRPRTFDDDEAAFVFGPLIDVDDGEHSAQLVELSTMPVEYDGETRDRIRWDFAIDEPGEKVIVPGWTSTATGERSTARKWISALLGAESISKGRRIRRPDLVGRPCRIIVEHTDDGYPKIGLVLGPKAAKA
jgi:hypothetical protein